MPDGHPRNMKIQWITDTDHACLPLGRDTDTLFSNEEGGGRKWNSG
jgi:hypothetical protein